MEDFIEFDVYDKYLNPQRPKAVKDLFQRFESAICRAAIEHKSKKQLKDKVNQVAKIATEGGTGAGRHAESLAKRIVEVSADKMAIQENLLFVVDSIMRHAEKADAKVALKFERAFEPKLLQLFKQALRRDDTKEAVAKYFQKKLIPVWQSKVWFVKVLWHIDKLLTSCQKKPKKEEVRFKPESEVAADEMPDAEFTVSEYPPEPELPVSPWDTQYDPLAGRVYGDATSEVEAPTEEEEFEDFIEEPVEPAPLEEIPESMTVTPYTSVPLVPAKQATQPPVSYVKTVTGTQEFEQEFTPTDEFPDEFVEELPDDFGLPPGGFPEYSVPGIQAPRGPSQPREVTRLEEVEPSRTASTEVATSREEQLVMRTPAATRPAEPPPHTVTASTEPATSTAPSQPAPTAPTQPAEEEHVGTEEADDDDDLTALDRELLADIRARDVREAPEPSSETIIRTSPAPSTDLEKENLHFESTEDVDARSEDMEIVAGPQPVPSPTELPVPADDEPTPTSPADMDLDEEYQRETVPTVPSVPSRISSSLPVPSTVGPSRSVATIASPVPTLRPPMPGDAPGAMERSLTMSPTEEDVALGVPTDMREPTEPGEFDDDVVEETRIASPGLSSGTSATRFSGLGSPGMGSSSDWMSTPPLSPGLSTGLSSPPLSPTLGSGILSPPAARVEVVPSSPTEMPVPSEMPEPTSPGDEDGDLLPPVNLAVLTLVAPAASSPTEVAVPTERNEMPTEVGDHSPTEMAVHVPRPYDMEAHLPTIGSSESEMIVPPVPPRRVRRAPTEMPEATEMPVPTERFTERRAPTEMPSATEMPVPTERFTPRRTGRFTPRRTDMEATEMPVPTEQPSPTSPVGETEDHPLTTEVVSTVPPPTMTGTRTRPDEREVAVPVPPPRPGRERRTPRSDAYMDEVPQVRPEAAPVGSGRDTSPTELPVPTDEVRTEEHSPTEAAEDDMDMMAPVAPTLSIPPPSTVATDMMEILPPPPRRTLPKAPPRREPEEVPPLRPIGRDRRTPVAGRAPPSPTEMPVPTEQPSPTSPGDHASDMEIEPSRTQVPTVGSTRSAVPTEFAPQLQVPPPPRGEMRQTLPSAEIEEIAPPPRHGREGRTQPTRGEPSSPTEMPVPTEVPSDSEMEIEEGGTMTQELTVPASIPAATVPVETEDAAGLPEILRVPPPRRPLREATTPRDAATEASEEIVPPARAGLPRSRRDTTTPRDPATEEIVPPVRLGREGRTPRTPAEPTEIGVPTERPAGTVERTPRAAPPSPTDMPVPTERPSPTEEGDEFGDDVIAETLSHEMTVPGTASLPPTTVPATAAEDVELRVPPARPARRDATTPRDALTEEIAPPVRLARERARRDATTPMDAMTEEIAPPARMARERTAQSRGAAPSSPTEMPVPTERPSPTEEEDMEDVAATLSAEISVPPSIAPPSEMTAIPTDVDLQVPLPRRERRDTTTPRDALTEEIAPPARLAPQRTPRDTLTEEIAPPRRVPRERRTPARDPGTERPSPTEMPVPTELPSPTSPGDAEEAPGSPTLGAPTVLGSLGPPTTVASEDPELQVPFPRPPRGREATTPRDALTEEIAPPVRPLRDGRTPMDAQTEEIPPMRPVRAERVRTPRAGGPAPSSPSEMPVPTELPSPTSPGEVEEETGGSELAMSTLPAPTLTVQATEDAHELQVLPPRPPQRDARTPRDADIEEIAPPMRPARDARTPLADAGTEEIPPMQPVRRGRERTPVAGAPAPTSPTEMPVPTEQPSPTSPGAMDAEDALTVSHELTVPGSLPPPSIVASDMEEVMVPIQPPRAPVAAEADVLSEDLGLVPPVPVRTGRDARTPRQDAGTEEIVPPAPRERQRRVRTPVEPETEIPIPTEMPVPTEQPSPTSVAAPEEEAPDAEELGVPLTLPSRAAPLAPAEAEEQEVGVPVSLPLPRRLAETQATVAEQEEEVLIRPPAKRRRQEERTAGEEEEPTEMPVPTEQPSPTSPVAEDAGRDEDQPMNVPATFNLREERTGVVTAPPSSPTELPQMYEPTSPAEVEEEVVEEPMQVAPAHTRTRDEASEEPPPPTVSPSAAMTVVPPSQTMPTEVPPTETIPQSPPVLEPQPPAVVEHMRDEEEIEVQVPTEVPPPTLTRTEEPPATHTSTVAPTLDEPLPVPVPVPQQQIAAPTREEETPAPPPADADGTQVLILRFPNAPHPAPPDFKRKLVTSLRGIGATRLSELSLKLRPGLLAELRGPAEALRALRALGLQNLEVLQFRISAVQGPGPDSAVRQLRAAALRAAAQAVVAPSPSTAEQTPMEYPSPAPSGAAPTPGSVTSLPAAATPPTLAIGSPSLPTLLRGGPPPPGVSMTSPTLSRPSGFKSPLTPIERLPGQPGTPDYSPTEDLAEPGTPQDATVGRVLRAAAGREPSVEPHSYSYLEETADLKDALPPTPTYVGSSPTYVDDAEPPTPTLDADSAGYGDDVESVQSWFQSVTPRPMRPGGTPDSAGPLTPTSAAGFGGRTPQVQPLTPMSVTSFAGPGTPVMRLPGMESPTPTYEADEAHTEYNDDASSLASWVENATPRQTAGTTTPLSMPGTPGTGTPGTSIPGAPTTPLGFSALGTPPPGQPVTPASGGPGTPHATSVQPGTPQTLQQDSTIVGEPGTPQSTVGSVQLPGTPLGSAASAASTPLAVPAGSTPRAATGGSTAAGTPPQPATVATGTPQGTAATGTPQSLQPATPTGQPGTPLQMAASSFASVSTAPLRPQMPPPAPAMPFVAQASVGMAPGMQAEYDPFAPPTAAPVGVPTAPGAPAFFSAPPPPPPGGPPVQSASSSAAEAPPPPPPPMAAGSSSEAPPAAGMPALASEVFPQFAGKRKQRGGGASSDEELPPWKRRAARRKKQ